MGQGNETEAAAPPSAPAPSVEISDNDRDSLHILPLAILPLDTPALSESRRGARKAALRAVSLEADDDAHRSLIGGTREKLLVLCRGVAGERKDPGEDPEYSSQYGRGFTAIRTTKQSASFHSELPAAGLFIPLSFGGSSDSGHPGLVTARCQRHNCGHEAGALRLLAFRRVRKS